MGYGTKDRQLPLFFQFRGSWPRDQIEPDSDGDLVSLESSTVLHLAIFVAENSGVIPVKLDTLQSKGPFLFYTKTT